MLQALLGGGFGLHLRPEILQWALAELLFEAPLGAVRDAVDAVNLIVEFGVDDSDSRLLTRLVFGQLVKERTNLAISHIGHKARMDHPRH